MSVRDLVVLASLVHVRLVITSLVRRQGDYMGFCILLGRRPYGPCTRMYPDGTLPGYPCYHHPGYTTVTGYTCCAFTGPGMAKE